MPKQPNILMLITDNQRLDTLGSMNQTSCHRPHGTAWPAQVLCWITCALRARCARRPGRRFSQGFIPNRPGWPRSASDYAEENDGSGDGTIVLRVPVTFQGAPLHGLKITVMQYEATGA